MVEIVPESGLLHSRLNDAARSLWVDAARDILIEGGFVALSLRRLAGSLGVTTGAFYSAFTGQDDLHEALRDKWREQNTTPLITAMTTAGADGFAQYLAALRVTVLDGGLDPRFDNAVRNWAQSSPRTAQVLAEVESQRMELLERMFIALGFDDKRAVIRARIAYFHQVGYGTIGVEDDLAERLLNLRYYAEALTGRDDLMVCDTADEVRQFILTGRPPDKAPT